MYKLIAKDNVYDVWPVVAPWVAQAMGAEENWPELTFIRDRAMQGYVQLWVSEEPNTSEIDFVMVTEGMQLAHRRVLVIRWLTAVNIETHLQDLHILEDWAKRNGYEDMQIWGREGWKRKMRSLGYEPEFTVVRKDLTRGIH
jgi:hypothetical protein